MEAKHEIKKMLYGLLFFFVVAISFALVVAIFDNPVDLVMKGSMAPIITFFVLICAIVAVLLSVWFYLFGRTSSIHPTKHGTSKILSPKEAKKNKTINNMLGTDGVKLSKQIRLTGMKSYEHCAIVGPTGSGKSASIFIPNLLLLDENSSGVVTDPKGELAEQTAQTLIERGFRVLILAPMRKYTMGYNLLANCKDEDEVREMSEIILANGSKGLEQITGTKAGGTEWVQYASAALKAGMLYEYRKGEKNMLNVVEMFNSMSFDVSMLTEIFDTDKEARAAWNNVMSAQESPKTMASVLFTLNNNLQGFYSDSYQRVSNRSDIRPQMLREAPTVLFIQYPEEKSAFFAPLMAPIYKQIMSQVKEKNGCPVYFFLDEFANIGRIGGIEGIAATVRSRKMSLVLGIQSFSQLKSNYGLDESKTLIENLKMKMILPGVSGDTAEYVSKLCGKTEMDTTSISSSTHSDGYSFSKTARDIMTPDEVMRLQDETCLMLLENKFPIIDQQERYYKNPKMLQMTKKHFDNDQYLKRYRARD